MGVRFVIISLALCGKVENIFCNIKCTSSNSYDNFLVLCNFMFSGLLTSISSSNLVLIIVAFRVNI